MIVTVQSLINEPPAGCFQLFMINYQLTFKILLKYKRIRFKILVSTKSKSINLGWE